MLCCVVLGNIYHFFSETKRKKNVCYYIQFVTKSFLLVSVVLDSCIRLFLKQEQIILKSKMEFLLELICLKHGLHNTEAKTRE